MVQSNSTVTARLGARAQRVIQSGFAWLLGNSGSVVLQLISVPILIFAWGTQLYGEWLIVSTMLGYMTLSDLGVTTVAHNRIDAAIGAGDAKAATRAFLTSLILLAVFTSIISAAFVIVALIWAEPLLALFEQMPDGEIVAVFVVLLVDGALMIGFAHGGNLLRSLHRFPEAIYRISIARLLGLGAVPAAALLGAPPLVAAITMLAVHLVNLGVLLRRLRSAITWLVPGTQYEPHEAMQLVRLSASFLLLPISNIIALQVSVLVVAGWAGSEAVALFVSMRTLTRLITQFVTLAGQAVWSEIAHSTGMEDWLAVRRMASLVLTVAPLATIALVAGFVFFGESFFMFWTHSKFVFDRPLFLWLTVNAAVLGLSTAVEVFLLSTNRHTAYALVYFGTSVSALGIGWALLPSLGLWALPMTATLFGLLPIGYCLNWLRRKVFS